jgi:hypothetical protein
LAETEEEPAAEEMDVTPEYALALAPDGNSSGWTCLTYRPPVAPRAVNTQIGDVNTDCPKAQLTVDKTHSAPRERANNFSNT